MMTASTNIITSFVGNNALGGRYFGDGDPATFAGLNGPYDIAFDKDNNLYFADPYYNAIY